MMNKQNIQEIEILHKISKITGNFSHAISPLDLLTQLLQKLFLFFEPEHEVIFSNLQCFALQSTGHLKRMENIPAIFNNKIIEKKDIPASLKNILLFLSASKLLNVQKNEATAIALNIFRDKFNIETVRIDGNKIPETLFRYNNSYNTLSIYIPDIYSTNVSNEYLSFVEKKLDNLNIHSVENDGLIVDGALIDSLMAQIMTSNSFKEFAEYIFSFINDSKIKKTIQAYVKSLSTINDRFSLNIHKSQIIQFCKTIILHSLLKPSKYSYQIILTKRDNINAPYFHGTYLFNSNKSFPHDKLNLFHIGLNMSLSAINESAILEKHTAPKKSHFNISNIRNNTFYGMVGDSKAMLTVYEKIRKVARFDSDVLVLGESGTGKDMVAQAIHQLSNKKDGPFIPVSLSDRPDTLIDSELFGHEKGSFTGATHQKKGYFERAEGGTLFLDEISHIPLNIQAKLLRVFQSRSFERVGGERPIKTDVRIICATSENLQNKIIRENLEFLDPLYYRLEQFIITVPPLRERKKDISLLIDFYLDKMNNGKEITISHNAIEFLLTLDWPGNIRQLIAALKRAYIEAYDEGEINPQHFEMEFDKHKSTLENLNRNLKTTLVYLRQNNFVIDRTLSDINQNAFKVSRKTLIRYTRELCLWFLNAHDWDLKPAIKNMAGKVEFERNAAIRYRNYFIGDKRSIGIINLLSKTQDTSIKELFHNEFEDHLLHLKKLIESDEITKKTWNYILAQYI